MEEKVTVSPDFESKFTSFVGKLGVLFSVFLLPPVFKSTLSVSSLVLKEEARLWVFSVLFMLLAFSFVAFAKKIKVKYALILFVINLLFLTEIITRVVVNISYEEKEKQELGMLANKTYEEFSKYQGHPFLTYTGKPAFEYKEGDEIKKTTNFNSMGFVGNDFNYHKSKGTVRVACIGGSTTERGYPAVLEYQLNRFFKGSPHFEVMNFGVSGWTSANSLVNYVLNVRSFNPDYVVVHHGWNESKVRNTPKDLFKTDYSHALTYFHEPEIVDKIPMRLSVLYRILKNKFSNTPDWMFLGDATTVKNRKQNEKDINDIEEMMPFKRNIQTIIDLCKKDQTKIVISTQPFSLIKEDPSSRTIEQANKIMRDLFLQNKDSITLFIDLDNTMTGNLNNAFVDLGHLNKVGTFLKGREFARVIINDWVKKDTLKKLLPYDISPISYHSFVERTMKTPEKLNEKAQQRGVSPYEMLKIDANYIFKQKNKSLNTNKLSGPFNKELIEFKIRSNPQWMADIKVKAQERGIDEDEMVQKDVNYTLKKQNH